MYGLFRALSSTDSATLLNAFKTYVEPIPEYDDLLASQSASQPRLTHQSPTYWSASAPPISREPAMSCRLSTNESLTPTVFDSVACADCFFFIYMVVVPYATKYYTSRCPAGLLICTDPSDEECNCNNPRVVYNLPDFTINRSQITPLDRLRLEPPLYEHFAQLTRQCCEAARDCCTTTLKPSSQSTQEACPATWDGWQCFDTATAGSVIEGSCPPYIYGDNTRPDASKHSLKMCSESGWVMRPNTNSDWTDYSGCAMERQEAQVKLLAGIIAFSISVVCLIPAIFILYFFRRIRSQPMFVVHRHLLIAFVLSGLLYLFTCFFYIVDGAPGDVLIFANHISCRLLFLVQLRFLRLATFSWMLAEGVYLFRLLQSDSPEGESLTIYKVLCWGVPAGIAVIYGVLREALDNKGCWVLPSENRYIEATIMIPCILALSVNVVLMSWILYILVKKLRDDPHLERMQYKKAVRAAVILIPVFGLQFLFTIYRLQDLTHQVINLIMDGLQGCAVSIIFCYTNKSVWVCARKWWKGVCDSRSVKADIRARMSIQHDTKLPLVETC
ncbi:hypothetical protein Y032_0304g1928 [Ancylostoma ceylanicum]|uniref:G-protein coupled receptors family 2 profile 2 domain-containing protein n=1 Tax=Ancylostoma ceylanicum TaxID=53326 RepID=A0A016S4H1_9BILA|nr:hypothetical protein Y032_0304g1928 [Ancylostoma ceylanicum]